MQTGWKQINGQWYYFQSDGKMKTGWLTLSGRTYYLNNNGNMAVGWKQINDYWYYFDGNGVRQSGWKQIYGKWYYFSSDGKMRTGWVRTSKNVWGYYTSKGYAGKAGWKKKDGDSWYYITKNGRAKTGWITLGSSKFYLDGSNGGKMVVGPHKFASGRIYFFDLDGRLAKTKGWKYHVDGSYYTYASGRVAVNTTIDGIKVGADGKAAMSVMDMKAQKYSSSTDYLILVDKSTFIVCVYKGKRGAWVKVKGVWRCTHGGSNTPNGVWVIDDHVTKRDATWGWADFDYSSAAFACHISAGNYFHTILFEKGTRGNPYNQPIRDGNLRRNYSNGCIRLRIEDAQWVWDNIPFGTKVVVYNS
jgi:glucan-binding YG repeat protein